jgi:hypothetical protein
MVAEDPVLIFTIDKKLNVFADASFENFWISELKNQQANGSTGKTYYLTSFSKKIFVSSSVNGRIVSISIEEKWCRCIGSSLDGDGREAGGVDSQPNHTTYPL